MIDMSRPGLTLVMMDCAPGHEEEFTAWYNEEHFPERATCPGFLSSRRFEAVAGHPKFHTIYEFETLGVLTSPAYLKVASASPWSLRTRQYHRNSTRDIFADITAPAYRPQRPRGGTPGAILLITATDCDFRHEDEFNRWYDQEYSARQARCPGFVSVRRFVAVEGGPKYLALSEFDTLAALESDEFRRLEEETLWSAKAREQPPARDRRLVRNICVDITPQPQPFTGRRVFT